MPSGYEKSPDYGGPEPSWMFYLAIIIIMIAIAALVASLLL